MTIRTASELDTELKFISTGVPSFDKVLGGGIALGKITLFSGQPSVGKSTLAYSALAEAQKLDYKPLLYDVEYAYDKGYCESVGINPEALYIVQEPYAEDGLDAILEAIASGQYKIIVIDSIGALLSRIDAEKTSGEKSIGTQASLTARFIRRAVPMLAVNNVALVCLTHEFTDIMSGKIMASGGAKLMYHASIHARLKPKFGSVLKSGDVKIGKVIVMEMKKNKLAPMEGKEAEAQFIYGESFSKEANLMDAAIDAGIITKEGNSYFAFGDRIGIISKLRLKMKEEGFSDKIKEALGHEN